MSPQPSLNADSRVAPSTTGRGPTVDLDKTPQASLNPSQGAPTADGGEFTVRANETYVDNDEGF